MAKGRKIKCDCGEYLREKIIKIGKRVRTEALTPHSFKVELI